MLGRGRVALASILAAGAFAVAPAHVLADEVTTTTSSTSTTTTTTEPPAPEPAASCVGFACLDEETVTAIVLVGAFGLGLVAGRGLWG